MVAHTLTAQLASMASANTCTSLGGNANATFQVALDSWTGATPAFTYDWYDNGGYQGTTANGMNSLSLSQNDIVPHMISVYVFNEDSSCFVWSNEVEYWVYSYPVAQIETASDSVCIGAEITLTPTVSGYSEQNSTYVWSTGDRTESITVTVNAATDYWVRITPNVLFSCVTTDTIHIGVMPEIEEPTVKVEGNLSTTPYTLTAGVLSYVCDGGQVKVSASFTSGPREDYIYKWYRNGIEIPGADSASFIDMLSNDTDEPISIQYSVVVTSASGCSAKDAQSLLITVLPAPNAYITGPTQICEGTDDYLNVAASYELTDLILYSATYKWYVDGVLDPSVTTRQMSVANLYPSTNPHQIRVTIGVNELTGCSVWAATDFEIRVDATPILTLTASDTTICKVGDVELSVIAISSNEIPGAAYNWINATTEDTLFQQGYTITITPESDVMYKVDFYQYYTPNSHLISSCKASSDTITIHVADLPLITAVQVTPDTICSGTQVTVSATSTVNTGDVPSTNIYKWYRNGAEIAGVTDSVFSETLYCENNIEAKYIYTVTMSQSISGCASDTVVFDTVCVRPMPTV